MSDRPMHLKYETKMKIMLCIFLLNITAVSVFGQSVPLNGILGQSVKFPAAVKKDGFLIYSGVTIGDSSREPPGNETYRGRVQWDSSTGFFSLSGLKMEDSGEYKVQNTDQNIKTVFQLNVYKDNVPVSKPHVSITHNEYPCTIECTAERGTGATLSWYREGEKKSLVSSRVKSAPHLHLPESVERSGTYTCEAKNSVSRETSDPLTVRAHCTAVFGQSVELNGIVGQSVEFPAAVKKGGFLMYSGVTLGDSSFMPPRNVNYRDRLQWDSSTGFFSLSGLKMEDSGEYKVQNTDQNIAVFQLNVYKANVPVSKPHVSITRNEYPCTIECTAERGTEATLSWYREGQKKPYGSSPVRSAPDLYLPQTVHEGGIYTCEAKNSVSNEKASITVEAHCKAPSDSSTWIIVAIIIAAAVVVVAVGSVFLYCRFIRRRRGFIRRRRGETILELSPDAVRTLIQVNKLLKNVDPQAYEEQSSSRDGETILELSPDGKTSLDLSPDVVRTLMDVKKLFDDFDLRTDGKTSLDLSPDD